MTETCPMCGSLSEIPLTFHLDCLASTLYIGERSIYFTNRETEILKVLIDKFGKVAQTTFIFDSLYSLEEERYDTKIVSVFICKIRQKLKGTKLHIETFWGRGYCLRYGEEDDKA